MIHILFYFSYSGDIKDEETLNAAVVGPHGGPKNLSYAHLVAWIGAELRVLCDLEEQITPLNSPDEHSSFVMEVCSFIKELGLFLLSIFFFF